MAPDFSYILYYLFGLPPDNGFSVIKTFGLLLALAILTGAWLLSLELRRKEREGLLHPVVETVTRGEGAKVGEVILNAVIGFLVGFKLVYAIQHWAAFQADAAGVLFSGKGSWVGGLLGAALLAGSRYWQKQKQKLPQPKVEKVEVWPHERIGDITILAAVSGVVGAKLFDVLEHLDQLIQDPIRTLFSGGGLAIYGGLIVAFVVVYFYLKNKKITPIHVMDAVAPALIVAYGVGRLGCHFSGDGDWGIVNDQPVPGWWFLPDWLWAYNYPHNVLNEGPFIEGCTFEYCHQLVPPVYPTPVYEVAMAFAIGGILWALRKRLKIPGMLFSLYLIFNGIERFAIESIRVNKRYDFGWLQPTQAEIISVVLVIVGFAMATILWMRHKKKKR